MIQALDRFFACTVNLIRNQNIQNLKHLITGGTGQNLSLDKWQYARAGPSERSRGSPRGLANRPDRAGAPRVDLIPSRRSADEEPSSSRTSFGRALLNIVLKKDKKTTGSIAPV